MIYKWINPVVRDDFIEIRINLGSTHLKLHFNGKIEHRLSTVPELSKSSWIEL